MTPVFTVLEKYWYVTVLILTTYVFIILIIELKDLKYLHFNFRTKTHKYKETKSWTRLNQLFLREFKFYKERPFTDLITRVHMQFQQVIVHSTKINIEGNDKEKVQKFIEKVSNQELQIFLKDPYKWLNWVGERAGVKFIERAFKKNNKAFKKLLPFLINLEKHFLSELQLDSIGDQMDFESEFYKGIFDKDKNHLQV